MDPLNCHAKFEVKQPPNVHSIRPLFYGSIVQKLKNSRPYSEDIWRLYDLNLCLTTYCVHIGNIWDKGLFGLIGIVKSQKWPHNHQFY